MTYTTIMLCLSTFNAICILVVTSLEVYAAVKLVRFHRGRG